MSTVELGLGIAGVILAVTGIILAVVFAMQSRRYFQILERNETLILRLERQMEQNAT